MGSLCIQTEEFGRHKLQKHHRHSKGIPLFSGRPIDRSPAVGVRALQVVHFPDSTREALRHCPAALLPWLLDCGIRRTEPCLATTARKLLLPHKRLCHLDKRQQHRNNNNRLKEEHFLQLGLKAMNRKRPRRPVLIYPHTLIRQPTGIMPPILCSMLPKRRT